MVQGGLPVGSSVVLQGPPGQEKLRFALTFLAEGLRAGGSALVVTASQSPDAVVAELQSLGVNLVSVTNENRLRIVDWYSWSEETVHDIDERGIVIRSSIDLTNLGVALSRAIAALAGDGPRRAVIELLSPATSSYEVTQVYAFAQSAKRKFDRHQFTSLVLLEKEMHSNPQLTTLHQPFDGVIEIERSRSGDRIIRKIGVLHLKDTAPDPTFRVLEMTEGGMRVVGDPAKPTEPGSVGRGRVLESQDERAQRLRLILQIATERLKLNPRDADALFAMAAAQATLDDAKGGLETLDRLAQIDSAYPGLWVLKTKLHAKLGQADLARLSRVRAFESEPEAAQVIDATVPCPMCEAPVAIDATSCANCGVKFTPTRTLEDELDDLGHAAIQEMVEEELGEEKSRAKPVDKPASPPPKSPEERPPTRPAKPIEATPSKRGLTNGLLLGRRGAPKAGRTNGLRGRYNGPAYPIQIDGQFNDWASVATEAMATGGVLNANVDVVRFGVTPNLGPFAFYVEVAGSALAGGGPPPGTMDTVRIFVDIDGSSVTGYRIDGLGADRMLEVSGHNGTVLSSTLWEFDSNRNQKDWNGWIKGTATPAASSGSRIETEGTNVLAQVAPTSRDVTFSFAPIQLVAGSSTNLAGLGDFASTSGETFGVRLPAVHPFGLGAGVVSLRENPGARMLGYLGFVPSTPRVDGAFDEWTSLSSDTTNDVGPRSNPNIDLGRYGAQRSGTSTFLYTDVTGRLFHGTPVPEHPQPVPAQSQGPADTDRDGVPDAVDPFPFDFNNDGIPDAQTNGDYDGDGITDYGFPGGTDYWLNTTIPSTFPAPYAGRSVSLYIGPDNRPPVLGDDVIRIFLDIDNSTFSGYSIGGIGADRLVEFRGKDGTVTQSALLAFTGSYPGQWAWTPLAPVTVALGYHAVELSVPLNASKLYVESGDFWESVDSTTAVPALVSRISSFRVAPASAPLVVPWTEAGPQATAVQLDPSANSPTTVYNQQRKVVRAGDVSGQTACDATNSDGCWYVVFSDQVVESTTAPSTETITTGTSCGGSFPAGIQTSDDVYRCYRETNIPGSGGSAAYQGVGIIAASTGADVTPSLPTYQPNDIFLLLGWVRDQDDTVTVSGWTAIPGTPFDRGTTSRYWLFWRRAASSSETAPLFDKSGTTGDTYAWIIGYRGAVTTGNPWQAVGTPATGTSDPASIPAISTTTDNALVVVAVGGEDNNNAAITTTSTNPASYTVHYAESPTGSDGALTFSEELRTSPGSTGAISVDWDVLPPVGWGGMALALAPPPNYKMSVKYDFTSVPSGSAYTLRGEAFHTPGEPILVQVVDSTETTWTTRMTLTATSDDNVDQTYTLTTDEYDGGSPNIRFVGAVETGDTAQTDFSVDRVSIDTNTWDRIVLMRSSDTSGSTWGAQVILASGRSADSPLVLTRDSGEPSIAIDSSGYLHVVWVSASAAGDQSTLNLVRYTRTTIAYPTQSQVANGGNWQAVTSVDDTSPGYMPTISTDTGGYPHIAWSQSKTVAPEGAGVAYRSNTGTDGVNSLKTRSWDGSAWGSEVEQPNAGSPVRMVRSARSPIDPDTSIVVTQGDDGWLDAYVCTPSCTMTSDVGKAGTVYFHPFDVAFEQSSGDALLAWGGSDGDNTHDIGYMTYVSGAWSAVQWYDDTTNMIANVYGLVVLAPKKGSDQIGLVGGDINQLDITALIWDGSAFTNFVEVNTNSNQPGYENAAIA